MVDRATHHLVRLKLTPQQMAEFCKRHRIRRLALFGSVLREDFGPQSDIDVLVEFESGVRTGLKFFAIQEELSRIFGRPVDLHTPQCLSKYFRDRVLSDAEVQYVAP